jgi:hypothetical protein
MRLLLVLFYLATAYLLYKGLHYGLLNGILLENVMFIIFIGSLVLSMVLLWLSGGVAKTILEYIEQKHKKVALEEMNYVWDVGPYDGMPLMYVLRAVKLGKLKPLNDDQLNHSVRLLMLCVFGLLGIQLITWPTLFSISSLHKPERPVLVEAGQPFYCKGKGATALYEIKFYSDKTLSRSSRVGSVPAGNGFSILQNDGDYYLIKTGFGFRGWFHYKAQSPGNKSRILENCNISTVSGRTHR